MMDMMHFMKKGTIHDCENRHFIIFLKEMYGSKIGSNQTFKNFKKRLARPLKLKSI